MENAPKQVLTESTGGSGNLEIDKKQVKLPLPQNPDTSKVCAAETTTVKLPIPVATPAQQVGSPVTTKTLEKLPVPIAQQPKKQNPVKLASKLTDMLTKVANTSRTLSNTESKQFDIELKKFFDIMEKWVADVRKDLKGK